ncbi:hypothetical protein H4S02_012309, partial [Coemansia sp. RSA 2611]
MPDIWDAEEIADDYGERPSAPSMAVFDAEEVEDSGDGGFGDGMSSSPVRIDAYETESIFSVPALQHEHDEYEEGDFYVTGEAAMVAPVTMAARSGDHDQQEQISLPLQRQVSDTVITPLSQGSSGVASSAATQVDRQQQDSSAFKVKGVRHVLSYGADFDKTAANLLSSIKTNIAKKAAATGGNATSRPVPNAASIAAAIELHQLKQQQQQPPPISRRHEIDEAGSSLSAERHTSRLSGFFGFGPRTHKHHPAPSPSATVPTQLQQQQPAAAPASMPQSQHQALGASGSVAGLRVVTDFQSLRGGSSGAIAAAAV